MGFQKPGYETVIHFCNENPVKIANLMTGLLLIVFIKFYVRILNLYKIHFKSTIEIFVICYFGSFGVDCSA